MITTAQEPFSTLRLLSVPAGSDPYGEPLLSNAGLLIEGGVGADRLGRAARGAGRTGPVSDRNDQ